MSTAKLLALYRRLPALQCQGKCGDSCGPIVVAEREHRAMVQAAGGRHLTVDAETATCGYLIDGRCSVYDVRPLICRLWGIAQGMRCPFGCVPERVISRPEGHALFNTLRRIGGPWVEATVTEIPADNTANTLHGGEQ